MLYYYRGSDVMLLISFSVINLFAVDRLVESSQPRLQTVTEYAYIPGGIVVHSSRGQCGWVGPSRGEDTGREALGKEHPLSQ